MRSELFKSWGDGAVTAALLLIAGLLILIALFGHPLLKALALAYASLP